MLLDICPTLFMYEKTSMQFAVGYWHWFFLLQPSAEQIIAGNPMAFYNQVIKREDFATEANDSYVKAFRDPECVHAVSHSRSDTRSASHGMGSSDRRTLQIYRQQRTTVLQHPSISTTTEKIEMQNIRSQSRTCTSYGAARPSCPNTGTWSVFGRATAMAPSK